MIETEITNIHWPYYLAFEEDIEKISRYIDFDKSNYCTHSIELARILLAASSETDVLLKELCMLIDSSKNPQRIDQYREILAANNISLNSHGVESSKYGLKLNPWSNWEKDINPEWWWAYNRVKHERSNFFHLANLKNTLNSVAALLVVNIQYDSHMLQIENQNYKYELRDVINHLNPRSELFRIDDPWAYFRD